MSTLASKVKAARRHRRAVAREIMHELPWLPTGDGHSVRPPYLWSTGRAAALAGPDDLLSGDVTFDVHAAREHAKTLMALADEQAVFEDWCRARGLGPENREPGAFGHHDACGPGWECGCRGGWPGKLAREWPGDSRAPMGRSLARLGQRILDMLEGQPIECQGCMWPGLVVPGVRMSAGFREFLTPKPPPHAVPCPDCQGTGHNLHGVLPPLEWSPAVRQRARDTVNARLRTTARPRDLGAFSLPARINDAYEAGRESGWTLTRVDPGTGEIVRDVRTRVVARGQHRTRPRSDRGPNGRRLSDQWRGAHEATECESIVCPDYTWGPFHESHVLAWRQWKLPHWRRGEHQHQRQRQERARRHGWGDDRLDALTWAVRNLHRVEPEAEASLDDWTAGLRG